MKRSSLPGLMHHHRCSRAEGICSYWVLILQIQLCNLHILFCLHQSRRVPLSQDVHVDILLTRNKVDVRQTATFPSKIWLRWSLHAPKTSDPTTIGTFWSGVRHRVPAESCQELLRVSMKTSKKSNELGNQRSIKRKCIRNQACERLRAYMCW